MAQISVSKIRRHGNPSVCGLVLLSLVSLSACATGGAGTAEVGGPPLTKTADGGVELEGQRYKLPHTDVGLDGRIVEFKKVGGKYEGRLVEVGRQLAGKVEAYPGMLMFELIPTPKPNEYRGSYKLPSQEAEITDVSISPDGEELKCSNESSRWTRLH